MRSALNFLSTLTAGKIFNYFLVNLSYYLSLLLKRPVVWGKPYSVSIEPTCLCCLECPECPTGMGKLKRRTQEMNLQVYEEILDSIRSTTLYLMLYFQGEPFMRREICSMIKQSRAKKIFTATSTNGQFLDDHAAGDIIDSGLDRLIISVDGTDQATYEKYRVGGDLNTVLTGTRRLMEKRTEQRSDRPEIIYQFLVFRHNQHQVKSIRKLARELGVDKLWIKSAQIYREGGPLEPPDIGRYSRYLVDQDGALRLKGKLRNRCSRLWRTMVITTDGVVVPCCFDKIPDFPMGSLHDKDPMEIWKGEKMNEFRRRVLTNRKGIEICRNCTE